MVPFILLIVIAVATTWFFSGRGRKKVGSNGPVVVNTALLEQHVLFYAQLNEEDKKQFDIDISGFLEEVKITGVDTRVEELDKLLIAAAAIIPIFYFKQWKYHNLQEVLLYSDAINMNFESNGNADRNILGMVGSGSYEGMMLLSRHALHEGFDNKTDKQNTAIHEFVHLIDKSDGDTDGIPNVLLDKQYVLPWINMIREQMQQIAKGKSDINPYAAMNKAEFLAVVAEYFFERPALLEDKHPQLYGMLKEMFDAP
jgi:MtfA peptidase